MIKFLQQVFIHTDLSLAHSLTNTLAGSPQVAQVWLRRVRKVLGRETKWPGRPQPRLCRVKGLSRCTGSGPAVITTSVPCKREHDLVLSQSIQPKQGRQLLSNKMPRSFSESSPECICVRSMAQGCMAGIPPELPENILQNL